MTETPDYTPGKTNTIAIDEASMKILVQEYANIAAAIHTRANNYAWNDRAHSNLNQPFILSLGSSQAATDLVSKITTLHTALIERLKTTKSNAEAMNQGLLAILADATSLEHINTMTADEFAAQIPVAYTPSTTTETGL